MDNLHLKLLSDAERDYWHRHHHRVRIRRVLIAAALLGVGYSFEPHTLVTMVAADAVRGAGFLPVFHLVEEVLFA